MRSRSKTSTEGRVPALEAFAEDGFLVVRALLGAGEVAEVHARLDRYVREVVPGLEDHVYYEDPARPETLKQLQRLQDHDPWFAELFRGVPFESLAESLLGGPVVGVNMQYFSKPPRDGRATPPHQDGHYFMIEPLDAVTMWLALDDVDEENGCVRYVRGSHRAPLRRHMSTGTLGFSQGIVDYGTLDRRDEVALAAAPGDLLVHHAGTIHRADGNRSADRPRRALGFIYYSARAAVDEAQHAAYQRSLRDQLERAGRV